ncbi:SDR family oxidoreductase [Pontibacillus yanchengensis]|uniref:SDR family oxidoreductase n=2 Tax=Pontibacillus yanchengensis TaxID=462910 RepID=A0ACC7VFD7_9BACI|nr:SDR family oxidoreductase [Pontibacillus yanchengensis]MYL32294.1 SDR family oxidoreductase [Pontibacillus yanchengensis]MYL52874.1 SDR family oxidoreductase [Pontibacillus yanchengensis]
MDLGLQGKRVILLAASKGLGKAIATEFVKEGAEVLISSRDPENLFSAAQEIKQEVGGDGSAPHTHVCDLTSAKAIEELFEAASDKLGGVDVLINNAGGPPAGSFMQFKDEDWQQAFELNLLSFIRASRLAIPQMQDAGGGRILNIASSSIKQPIDGLILSNTFRTGIAGLSKSLANEYAKDNILVNTIGPGRIGTERVEELDKKQATRRGLSSEEVKAEAETQIPMGRYGEPEEFAKTAVYLASFANTYVTGETLVVDGGYVKAL